MGINGMEMDKMNKRGQFYILAVVLLLLIVFLSIPKISELPLPEESPANTYAKYVVEIPYFVNNAILNDDDSIIKNFTRQFQEFALDEGTQFSITYIFTSSDDTKVFTTAQSVFIKPANQTIHADESYDAGKVKFINLTIDDRQYDFAITNPSFKAVFITKEGDAALSKKDVFIYE